MNVSEKMNAAEGEAGVQNHGIEDGQRFDLDSLPLGYRFSPTDEELLLYLSNKAHHQPLPTNKIIELNLYAHHPEQLAGSRLLYPFSFLFYIGFNDLLLLPSFRIILCFN